MKIAVVGGGISGLASALLLNEKYEVHLFESESRLGGHANTVYLKENDHRTVPIDTGFLVYNTLTYPHLTRLFEFLGVPTCESNMSLSIQAENGLEWAGENFKTVFAQWRNVFNLNFLKMLFDVSRFNSQAEINLELSKKQNLTLEQLIKIRGYGKSFQTLYLLPMTGAIWSMSYDNALNFPAETFLTFCINHHLLQVNNRPIWRTVNGGSIKYVNLIKNRLKNVHHSSRVIRISKNGEKLRVSTSDSSFDFDKVVLATHAPTSSRVLGLDFPDLANELSPFKTTPNKVVLHQDERIMPKSSSCWSAWNVKARESANDKNDICLTYYINKLQPLGTDSKYFVTVNTQTKLTNVHQEFQYDHPQFDLQAIKAQQRLPEIQGRHGIYFAGAWTRYGFHEDGILSAVKVAKYFEIEPPWI